jgi:hypothetical protein
LELLGDGLVRGDGNKVQLVMEDKDCEVRSQQMLIRYASLERNFVVIQALVSERQGSFPHISIRRV